MLDVVPRDTDSPGASRGYQFIIGGSVLVGLSTFGMIGRLVSARMIKRSVQVDDLLLIFAYSLNVFEFGVITWATQHGAGRHISEITLQNLVYCAKVFLTCSFVQPAILMSSKMSLLVLLYRIFVVRSARIVIMIFMAIVMGWFISIIFATAFICTPFNSNWGASPANCGNVHILDEAAPVPWIITDFGILLIPLPMVRKLKLPLPQKVAVTGLFLIGGLTCIISCIRYKYVFFSFKDPTWDIISLAVWQMAESNMTIFCVCLVASRPFAMLFIPDALIGRIRSSLQSIRSTRSYTTSSSKHDPYNLAAHANNGLSLTSTSSSAGPPIKKGSNVITQSRSVQLEFVPMETPGIRDTRDLEKNSSSTTNIGLEDDFRTAQDRTYTFLIEGGRSTNSRDTSSSARSEGPSSRDMRW